MSAYGYGRPTSPRIAEWAERGRFFERAYSQGTNTGQTFAAMQRSATRGALFDASRPTLFGILKEAGYTTAQVNARRDDDWLSGGMWTEYRRIILDGVDTITHQGGQRLWDGDKVTVWTSNQMIAWGRGDLAKTLGIPKENVRLVSPYIGGGFGGKLFLRADALLAALAAREVRRPVKVALQRPLMMNNTTHRPATIQRIRLGATQDGKLTAIAHESWSGDQPGGSPETAVNQTRLLYAGEHRLTALRLAVLDLPEMTGLTAVGLMP